MGNSLPDSEPLLHPVVPVTVKLLSGVSRHQQGKEAQRLIGYLLVNGEQARMKLVPDLSSRPCGKEPPSLPHKLKQAFFSRLHDSSALVVASSGAEHNECQPRRK